MTQLLAEIEQYLDQTGTKPSSFGEAALNDRHFVRQLRNGRRLWPETEQRVRQYMATPPNEAN